MLHHVLINIIDSTNIVLMVGIKSHVYSYPVSANLRKVFEDPSLLDFSTQLDSIKIKNEENETVSYFDMFKFAANCKTSNRKKLILEIYNSNTIVRNMVFNEGNIIEGFLKNPEVMIFCLVTGFHFFLI